MSNAGKSVLVAERDPWVRAVMSEILHESKFPVHLAANATEARAGLAARSFHAIVVDAHLAPDGGFIVLREAAEAQPEARLVLTFSSFSGRMDWPGDTVFLPKPFDAKTLISAVGGN